MSPEWIPPLLLRHLLSRALPSPPLEEEVRNYLPLSCTLVLEKYYQWPSDLLKLAIKLKWDPERTDWDQAGFYNAAGKEAHTKVRFTENFDLDDLALQELKNNPDAELPRPATRRSGRSIWWTTTTPAPSPPSSSATTAGAARCCCRFHSGARTMNASA